MLSSKEISSLVRSSLARGLRGVRRIINESKQINDYLRNLKIHYDPIMVVVNPSQKALLSSTLSPSSIPINSLSHGSTVGIIIHNAILTGIHVR
jgi:hypothetical protein